MASTELQRSEANLLDVPSEIKKAIFDLLPTRSVVALQIVHPRLVDAARVRLYEAPEFTSTFRLAQFVHTVAQKPALALLVRSIDLSNLTSIGRINRAVRTVSPADRKLEQTSKDNAKEIKEQGEAKSGTNSYIHNAWFPSVVPYPTNLISTVILGLYPREHLAYHEIKGTSLPPVTPKKIGLAEVDHPFFQALHRANSIPIGFIFHILTLCTNLQALDLERASLDAKYHTEPGFLGARFFQHEWSYLFTFHLTSREEPDPASTQPTGGAGKKKSELSADKVPALQYDLMRLIFNLKGLEFLGVSGFGWWITDKQMAKLLRLGPFKDREQKLKWVEQSGKPGRYLLDLFDEQAKAKGRPPVDREAVEREFDQSKPVTSILLDEFFVPFRECYGRD